MILLEKKSNENHSKKHPVVSANIFISAYLPFDSRNSKVSLRNQLRYAENKILALLPKHHSSAEKDELIAKIYAYTKNIEMEEIHKSIVLFCDGESCHHVLLKEKTEKLVVVSDSFHFTPLLKKMTEDHKAAVIVVNGKSIKLFQLTGQEVKFVESRNIKDYLAETVGDIDEDQRVHFENKFFDSFFNDTIKNISRLHLKEKDYVAVMGPKLIRNRFVNELNKKKSYKIFYNGAISSNLETMATELSAKLRKEFDKKNQKKALMFSLKSGNSLFTDSLHEIAKATVEGRVESLMVDPKDKIWGRFDRSTGEIVVHEKQSDHQDDCIIDDILEEVIAKGGKAHFFDTQYTSVSSKYVAKLRW